MLTLYLFTYLHTYLLTYIHTYLLTYLFIYFNDDCPKESTPKHRPERSEGMDWKQNPDLPPQPKKSILDSSKLYCII